MRTSKAPARLSTVLYASAFVVATCGLVYELVAGALASYLLGDSILWFSLIIGTYLSAMGVGSYLSRFIERNLLARFVEIEVAVALVGGFEAPLLFGAFARGVAFEALLFATVGLIGVLVGLELPLLMRVLERDGTLKDLVARVLFLDYIGALVASVAFPLVLLPAMGLLRTSLAFGLINAAVAGWTLLLFEAPRPVKVRLGVMTGAALALLLGAFAMAGKYEKSLDTLLYADPVVWATRTPYQRIAITRGGQDTRLFLDGALQFSTMDEYRYHESLVHPAMVSVPAARRVLVLGGGDGLAVREILRHAEVEAVVLVDLDPVVTGLFTEREELAALNRGALSDPRVQVVNGDALPWLRTYAGAPFDVAIIDFPDPNDYGLGKLYTTHFYRQLAAVMAPHGTIGMQATSPLFSPEAYWCIVRTIQSEGYAARPYHTYVPAFGEWGFVLATVPGHPNPTPRMRAFPDGLRYLDDNALAASFSFPRDMVRPDGPINRLDNQVLVRLYALDWRSMQSFAH